MKLKFAIYFLFVLSTRVLLADTNDSLVNVFNNGKHDTLKIKAALELASIYKNSAPEKTLTYATAAYEKSSALQNPVLMADAMSSIASYYYKVEKYGEGYSWMRKIEALGESSNNTTVILKALDARYDLFSNLNMLDRCVETREKIAAIHRKNGNKSKEARQLHLAGWNCYNAKLHEKGIKLLTVSRAIYTQLDDKNALNNVLGWLGNTYSALGKFDSALYFRNLVHEYSMISGNKYGLGESYRYTGDIYANMKKFDVALEYYNKAIAAFSEDKHANREFLLRTYKVRILDSLGRSKEAATELDYVISNKGKYNEKIVDSYVFKIGKSLYAKVNEPYKAFYYFRKNDSLENANNRDAAKQQIILAEFKSDVDKNEAILKSEYEKQQAIANANLQNKQLLIDQHQKEYLLLEKENELKQLSLIQSQLELKQKSYESDNQKRQVELLNKNKELADLEALKKEEDIRKQRNLISIFTIGGIIVLILFFFLGRMYIQKRKDHRLINLQKDLMEEKQKEILSSIQYAQRIQNSLLPTEIYIDKTLKRLNKN